MIKVSQDELSELVRVFVEEVAPLVKVSDGVRVAHITANDTLSLWMEVPDCSYSPMFLGWMVAQGYNICSFSAEHLATAVQHALVGENKNVMFDYLGDWDAKSKPH